MLFGRNDVPFGSRASSIQHIECQKAALLLGNARILVEEAPSTVGLSQTIEDYLGPGEYR